MKIINSYTELNNVLSILKEIIENFEDIKAHTIYYEHFVDTSREYFIDRSLDIISLIEKHIDELKIAVKNCKELAE